VPAATSVSAPTAPGAAGAPATPAAQPKSGGTLRYATPADLSSLEGHILAREHFDSLWNAFDRLTQLDPTLQPQPMLAESWDISNSTIKLNLRKGVTWHTGREFTSDDVKWNLLRVRDPKVGAAQLAGISNWFTTIDTPDKSTVILAADVPRPTSVVFDFFEYFNMLDPVTMAGADAKTKVVGTGPFTFIEWTPGSQLEFSRNPNYWLSGKPYLDGINMHMKMDPQTMVVQFEAGALDVMKTAPANDFMRLKGDPKYQSIVHPYTGAMYFIGINTLASPLDDPQVRQALDYSIDRKRFSDAVTSGITQPYSLPWPAASLAYEESKRNFYTFDLDKARALLQQAGHGNFDVDFLPSPSAPELSEFASIYQADLAKLGITLNIKQLDAATWQNTVMYPTSYPSPGRYMYTATYSYAALRSPVMMYLSGLTWSPDPEVNQDGFRNARYSELVNAATTELDTTRQKAIFSELNDILLNEPFNVPYSSAPPRVTYQANVRDVDAPRHEGFSYTTAWLAN
jgi:peptide/nickel transport system substrate-binding protein